MFTLPRVYTGRRSFFLRIFPTSEKYRVYKTNEKAESRCVGIRETKAECPGAFGEGNLSTADTRPPPPAGLSSTATSSFLIVRVPLPRTFYFTSFNLTHFVQLRSGGPASARRPPRSPFQPPSPSLLFFRGPAPFADTLCPRSTGDFSRLALRRTRPDRLLRQRSMSPFSRAH